MSINFKKLPSYIRNEINHPKEIIRKGKKGKTVKQIQEWLSFHNCHTEIDGDFGPATESCVKDFQQNNSITSDGKVNDNTWNLLVEPMNNALLAPSDIENMTPSEAIFSVAEQHVEQHPIEIGGANRGPWVRLYCEGNDGLNWPWCAGFVTTILQQAYFFQGSKSPIKGSVSCDTLAAQAKKAEIFVSNRDLDSDTVDFNSLGKCCLFLRRRTSTDWTHTGIAFAGITTANQMVFSTIEGNTNDEGTREGYEACRRTRSTSHKSYDFIKFE